MVAVQGERELPQVAGAFGAAGAFPGLLHGRQDQRHEQGHERNDDEQLDQREGRIRSGSRSHRRAAVSEGFRATSNSPSASTN